MARMLGVFMDGKFNKEQFKKAKVSDQIMMLYSALQYEKEFIRNALLGLAGDHLQAAKSRKIIYDKVEKMGKDMSFIKGSNSVLILVVVALVAAVIYSSG